MPLIGAGARRDNPGERRLKRPPHWPRTLLRLREAVRSGEINGTAGAMAAQVRRIISEGAMNYKPETLVTAVEWPLGWGEAIKPACAELGLNTLAEVHEAAKSEQGLRELSRKIAATAKINYLTDLARKVCGDLTDTEKARQKFDEPPAEQKAEWAKRREAEALADLGTPPRMTRPEGLRAGRAIANYNMMDKALSLLHAGCTPGQVARELMVEEKKLYDWAKKYPEFAKLSGLDSGPRKRGRKASSAPLEEPEAVEPVDDTPEAEPDDTEPFPPFPEDEETASDVAQKAERRRSVGDSKGPEKPERVGPNPTVAGPSSGDYHTRPTDKIERAGFRTLDLRKTQPAEDQKWPDAQLARIEADMRLIAGQVANEVIGALGTQYEPGNTLADLVRSQDETLAQFLGEMEELVRSKVKLHPFVQGLVQSLPEPGSVWSLEDRRRWIHCAETVFSLMYKLPVTTLQEPAKRPVIVGRDADADKCNELYGERYGVDWVYAEQEVKAPGQQLSAEAPKPLRRGTSRRRA